MTAFPFSKISISDASNTFGVSTIVVCVEAIKQQNGDYLAFTDNGRNGTEKEVVEWCKFIEKKGAGEILLVSVDRDGTGAGLDLDLIDKVNNNIKIPLVVNGGRGSIDHIRTLMSNYEISGLAVSSILHYDIVLNENTINQNSPEGNMNFLKNKRSMLNIHTENLKNLKKSLLLDNYLIRD